ncbi:hypothetical protein G9C85_12850 [Halorubellus sp. JP-L1]|uniref:hypothetical protein n=1 Tax=Halorubellus sp. JP-L1 TaxID=2715753 RepID=UPI00140794D1|nr:hypothetical protein [Halorubellus sp. JP-L1]NHN42508.1 hypothetical protein [Halorubellus sp. JP-L1]
MALDVEIPDPPDLSNRGKPRDFEMTDAAATSDFHREDLETLLHDSAWTIGFEEWLDRTDLTVDHFEAVSALGLFQAFDFYWHPEDEQLRDDAPRVPEDWRDRAATADLDSSDVSLVESELQDLGRTVREALDDELERSDDVSASLWADEPYGDREQ